MTAYRPANGAEGRDFEDAFCAHCQRDAAYRADPDHADSCPIIANAMAFHIGQEGYPPEWQYDADGYPTCTAFEPIAGPQS